MIQLLPNKGVVTIYMHPYIGVANSEKRTRIREYIGFDSVTSDKESYGISYAQYYYERIEWNIAKRDDVGAYMYTVRVYPKNTLSYTLGVVKIELVIVSMDKMKRTL